MKKDFFKNISYLFSSSILSSVFTFFLGVFSRRYLTPTEYGLWVAVSLIYLYGNLVQLGVINAFNQLMPRYNINGNILMMKSLIKKITKYLIVIFFIMIIISLGTILLKINHYLLISLVIIYIPIQLIYLFFSTLFSSLNHFNIVSRIEVFFSLSNLLIALSLVKFIGVYSLIVGLIFASLIGCVMYFVYYKKNVSNLITINTNTQDTERFEPISIRILIKLGIPLMLISLSWSFFTSIDRVFISAFLDTEQLGYFSLAIFMFQTLMILPQTYSRVLYPRLNSYFSRDKDFGFIVNEVLKSSKLLMYVVGFIFGNSYLLLPFFTRIIFPQYTEGIASAKIILFGIAFLSMVWVFIVSLNSINKQKVVLRNVIISIVISSILNFILISKGINGIALATSISGFLYFITLSVQFLVITKNSIKNIMKYYVQICGFIIVIFISTVLLSNFFSHSEIVGALLFNISLLLVIAISNAKTVITIFRRKYE